MAVGVAAPSVRECARRAPISAVTMFTFDPDAGCSQGSYSSPLGLQQVRSGPAVSNVGPRVFVAGGLDATYNSISSVEMFNVLTYESAMLNPLIAGVWGAAAVTTGCAVRTQPYACVCAHNAASGNTGVLPRG